jgi:hypothetical protein
VEISLLASLTAASCFRTTVPFLRSYRHGHFGRVGRSSRMHTNGRGTDSGIRELERHDERKQESEAY